jgi:hypothetical protein
MAPFNFDHAMCVYLGGEPDSGAVQIGYGAERLLAVFGEDAPDIKFELDRLLDTVFEAAKQYSIPDDHNVASWLASELPNLSSTCRKKIAARVQYLIEH